MTSELDNYPRNCNTFAVVSGKGGTGKSIIVASIANVLSHCGFKTIVVDLDLFTHGLTFYMLADYPKKVATTTSDIFKGKYDLQSFMPIAISSTFVENNLFLAPSIGRGRKPSSELKLNEQYAQVEAFKEKCTALLDNLRKQEMYDYVIIDTRGGTDSTSVGSALAAGSYIVVTEADKPSWDMGRLLIETIEGVDESLQGHVEPMGFVINKNVLPSEAIETFLKKEWGLPHLATVPLDEVAVRYFQEDKVPVAEDIGCGFSRQILSLIRKAGFTSDWKTESLEKFEALEKMARQAEDAANKNEQDKKNAEKYSFTIRIYGTVISTLILTYLSFTLVSSGNSINLFIVIFAAVLIFGMTASDPEIVIILLDKFIPGRSSRKSSSKR